MPPSLLILAAIALVATVAAAAQSISGFGMNLILAPVAQVVLPGAAAVRLVVVLAGVLNAGVLAGARRAIRWVPALLLIVPALIATFLVGPLVSGTRSSVLGLAAGSATLLAIAATALRRLPRRLTGPGGALLAGALAGSLNVSSGVSGPPVAAYAAAQPWTAQQLVATAQAVFLPGNVAAFFALHASVPASLVGAGTLGTVAGTLAGVRLRGHVSPAVVRSAVLLVAAIGALLVLVRSL